MNAAIISGFLLGLAGVLSQNAWYYWHYRRLRWLSWVLDIAGALLLAWGAGMAHRSITAVVVLGALSLAAGGTLAFVTFMAGIRHQGLMPVLKRMSERGDRRKS